MATGSKKDALKSTQKSDSKLPLKPPLKMPLKRSAQAAVAQAGFVAGKTTPTFELQATGDISVKISVKSKELNGQNFVLYFYPKDNTPGCTLEGQDFTKLEKDFKRLNCSVFGVSRDSVKMHEGFRSKCGLKIPLLSDPDEKLCRSFDVIKYKKLYGREFQGIERSTFLIDERGRLIAEWRKVKVAGHAAEVLAKLKEHLAHLKSAKA